MKRAAFLCVVVGMIAAGTYIGLAQDEVEVNDQGVNLEKMKSTFKWLQMRSSLEFIDTPLGDILALFNRQTPSLNFDWENEVLPRTRINFTVSGKPMGEALQQMLDQCKWTYAVKPDGRILLRPIPLSKKKG